MRAGRIIEEAGALAKRVGRCRASQNAKQLKHDYGRITSKDTWDVRRVTGRKQEAVAIDGVNAEALNRHYASFSTDPNYSRPRYKHTACPLSADYVTEWQVFKALEKRRPTATGLDSLPSLWFLKLVCPSFLYTADAAAIQLVHSNIDRTNSVETSVRYIRPAPKVAHPKLITDFRPISITPVLTRITERVIVTQYLYPAITSPSKTSRFSDQ